MYEDQIALGPQHAPHVVIDQVGHGAYSHWGGEVLFSSSDNTDPNSNVRDYKVSLATAPSWFPMSHEGCHICCNQVSVFDEFLKVDIELFAENDPIEDCDLVTGTDVQPIQQISSRRAALLSFLFGAHSRSDAIGKGLRLLSKLRLPRARLLGELFDSRSGHFLRMVFTLKYGMPGDIHKNAAERARDAMDVVAGTRIQVRLRGGRLVEFSLSMVAESHWSYHDEARAHLTRLMQERESGVFLEIGGRGVQSAQMRESIHGKWRYLALDIKPGANVDVVGDVHTMSSALGKEAVDVVYSVSVFEHLYMPWRAVLEIGAVLKMGGLCYVHTPYFWPVHEIPWDFFRPSRYAWSALFNAETGFEILTTCDLGLSRPIAQVANQHAVEACFGGGPQATVVLARKVADSKLRWDGYRPGMVPGMYPG
jgi:hypothetical protein